MRILAASIALLALACSSREGPGVGDAGESRDTGMSSMDSGPTPRDTGPELGDTGMSSMDSGPIAVDSGPMTRDTGPTPRDSGPADAGAGRDGGDCACPNSGTCMMPGEVLCAPAPDYPCMWADGWYAECTRTGWMCRFTTPPIC